MRFSRFFTACVLIAVSCAQQEQGEDADVPDDTPDDGGTNAVAGKATGGTPGKGGSSSTGGKSSSVAGKPANTAGADGGGEEGGESSGGTSSSGGTGGTSQGGKAAGGTAGKASGGTGGTGGKATAGAAGMSGSGGSSSGTGGGGTGGAGCKASPGGPVVGLSARYESEQDNASGTGIGSQLSVYNTSANTFNLADLKVRYYLSNEVAATVNKTINWAWLRPTGGGGQTDVKSQVMFNIVDMTCSATKADTYLEFTFGATAGELSPNTYVLFSWTANNASNQNFDQSNDYSFSAGQVIANDYANVVVLQNNGTKIWGTEP